MAKCIGCIHLSPGQDGGGDQCRRYPMTWQMVATPGAIAGTVSLTKHVGFAPADEACGEYNMGLTATFQADDNL